MGKSKKDAPASTTIRPQNQGELQSHLYSKFFPKMKLASQESSNLSTLTNNQTSAFDSRFNSAADSATADYGRMMGGYTDWQNNSMGPLQSQIDAYQPHQFTYQAIGDKRSPETAATLKGYQEFADTGGYSPTDIQELRARGISPIRSVYANAMQDIDRQRSLQGGYSPNYTAATESMTRQLPGQLADATTNVNAGLADAIRQGKLSGLSGVAGISEGEAGRRMQASMSNQGANLQAQGMTEDAYGAHVNRQLGAREMALRGLAGQSNLYGTTPGMASMFGNQALQANAQRLSAQEMQNNYSLGQQQIAAKKSGDNKSMWTSIGGYAVKAAPYIAMLAAMSDKNLKENITEFNPQKIRAALRKLPISTWNYKGDDTKHIGPMAQDFKKAFGTGDGKTIHLVDVMGVMLASRKAELENENA